MINAMRVFKYCMLALGCCVLLWAFIVYLWDGVIALMMTGHLWGPYARRLPITAICAAIVVALWLWYRRGRRKKR